MDARILTILSLCLIGFSLAACSPYSQEFSCPATYNGVCEPIKDAYQDSINGIDPRQFDAKWKEHQARWKEDHKGLISARKAARPEANGTGEAPGYRQVLFQELKDLIERPQTPVVIPPRVERVLVLSFAQGKLFVAPHYVYFMVDEPRWVLRKLPEKTMKVIRRPVRPKRKGSEKAEPVEVVP